MRRGSPTRRYGRLALALAALVALAWLGARGPGTPLPGVEGREEAPIATDGEEGTPGGSPATPRSRGVGGDVPTGGAAGTGASSDAGADGVSVRTERGEVEQVATRLLASYRDGDPCVLASSGYLDLLGSVWGCVVQGDGWVDVCVVSEEGDMCRTCVMRLDAGQVGTLVGERDEDDG